MEVDNDPTFSMSDVNLKLKAELNVTIDREKAESLGISVVYKRYSFLKRTAFWLFHEKRKTIRSHWTV
jgi:hypothetical protein